MAEDVRATLRIDGDNSGLVKASKDAKKAVEEIGKGADSSAKAVTAATEQMASATKKYAGAATEAAKQVRQVAVIQEKAIARQATTKTEERELGRRQRSLLRTRGQADVALQEAKTETRVYEAEERRRTDTHRANEKLRVDETRRAVRERVALEKTASKEMQFALKQASPFYALGWQAKTTGVPASQIFSGQIAQAISRSNFQQQVAAAPPGTGASQIWQQQMNQAVARANAQQAAFFAQQQGGGVGGGIGGVGGGRRGWRGGGWQRILGGGPGGFAAGLLGGLGVGVGGFAVARAGREVVEASQNAVAYDRQRLAAEHLAGSQNKLNALLEAYRVAAGGAVDRSVTLEKVTRLLATGFADSVSEVERFVSATRGASIALGKPQDYVIQETQLAISNTSVKRLDQIGLGIKEVQDRIRELREENRGWTREVAFGEAVLSLMGEKYGELSKSVEGQKTEVEQLSAAWSDFLLEIGQGARGPIDALAKLIRKLLEAGEAYEKWNEQKQKENALANYQTLTQKGVLGTSIADIIGMATGRSGGAVAMQFQLDYGMVQPRGPRGRPGRATARPQEVAPRFTDEQATLLRNYYDQFSELERSFSRRRLETIQQYEEQRSKVVRDYGKQLVREEEDFQRQRARSARDYAITLTRMAEDIAEREEQALQDLNERIADLREDNAERLADIEKKYRKDREKAERDHREKLLEAASRLDAKAVAEEQRRFQKESEERKEAHDESIDETRKNLQKQIDEAQQAYDKQLELARRQDEKQRRRMEEDRTRQLEDEDTDRRIRKERESADFIEQLGEMDRQHRITMERLAAEAEEQRLALQNALAADLAELGYYIEGYQEMIEKKDKAVEEWFDKIIGKLEKLMLSDSEKNRIPISVRGGPTPDMGYANGGPVRTTGMAMLHAGEYVLSRSMLANGGIMGTGGYSNSNSITVESGAIQVFASPSQSAQEIGAIVEGKLINFYRGMAA